MNWIKVKIKKLIRWYEVTACKHDWVETYNFTPDYKHRLFCCKCGELR